MSDGIGALLLILLALPACVSGPSLADYCATTQPAARALIRERMGLSPNVEMLCPAAYTVPAVEPVGLVES